MERVATPEVSADWLMHEKSSTSSSISVNNDIHYDINNEPIVGYAHSAHMYASSAQNASSFAHPFAYVRNFMRVPNNGLIVMSQYPDISRRLFNSKDGSFPV